MHQKSKLRKILSVVLAALMLATTLPETGISVEAAESGVVDSMAVVNPTEDVSNGDVITGNISDGNLLPGEEPTEPDEPGVTEEPGDVSGGNIGVETVSDGNEGQEENNTMSESAEILASGISRGCAWTLDVDGNLIVRDSDGEYGTGDWEDWGWRAYKEKITSVDMNVSYVSDPYHMFSECTAMESAKIKIDESKGIASSMFRECNKLVHLDLSGFNTKNITDMEWMFKGCSSLTSLDLSGFNTENVTDMGCMFWECQNLKILDVSGFNTENVTDMHNMFDDCSSLTALDVSSFNTKNVISMTDMFSNCSSLTTLDVSGFDTQNVSSMQYMFYNCSSLATLDVSGFDTQNVTYMFSMFSHCSSLTTLDVSGFDTQNVTHMYCMFNNCSSLTTLDVSGFNTQNVCDMSGMFENCSSLTVLDVSDFDTQNVKDMMGMFNGCFSLTTLDISGFDTRNVTDMYGMFCNCSSLTTLDVSGLDTQNVTNMGYMFGYCSKLASLDVSCFDTNKVTDMGKMFSGCESLISLDLSNFDMRNVTNEDYDTKWMFDECYNLKSIKTFPNLQVTVYLWNKMYDKDGNSYTEFPKGLTESIWLAKDVKDIPKELSFEKMNYEVREGQTCQLKLENLPAGVEASQFSFASSNPEVVTVGETGIVTAVSIGTANVTASYEKYKCTCKITVIEKGFYVEEIEDVIYTGSAVKPEVVVYDTDSILTEGVDYTLAYANNTLVADKDSKNAPKVTVTGKGNYTGKVVTTFTILPYDIEEGGVMVSLPQSVLVANGRVQKPAPVVTFNGKKLAANKDYTVSYPQLAEEGAYKNPGTYDVQVTFKNNFTGTKTVKMEIKEGTSISKVKVGAIAKMPYTGEGIIPKPVITMGTKTLVEGTDYKLTYINNILPGKASVKVTGMGEYVGERTLIFEITGTSISKAQVTGITDKTYNGKIQLQDIKVSLDNGTTFLTEGVDYKVVYEKNLNVGTAKVKIIGAGGYVGSINKSFRILPYNLTTDVDKAITGLPENLVVSYTKGGCKPELNLMFYEYLMDQKKECNISYSNNAKVGNPSDGKKAPTITIKGKGNFTGTITIPFTIVANDLSAEDTSVKLSVADVAFVNKAGKYISAPVLMDSTGKKLVAGTDYEKTIVYTVGDKVLDPKKDIVPVGSEVTVTVTGKGFYTGTISATYRITEKTFTSAKITIAKQTYTGKPIQLKAEEMKVVIGKDTLVYGVDFEVVEDSYINNVAKGTASVTIKGKGKYGGMKNVKFAIVPKGIN